MSSTWITTSSTNVQAMVDSINVACDWGYVPDAFHFMENSDVEDAVTKAIDHAAAIVEACGGDKPTAS